MRRFVPLYRSALLAALLSNTLMLVIGTVTSVIYDKVIPHKAFVTLWALAVAGGIALLFDLAARQLRAYLIDLAGKKTDLLVGTQLFRQSLGVRMEHRPESAGAYSHIVGQIELVRDFFSSATLSAISDLPFIFIFIAMAFVIGGPLGFVLVIGVPLILLATALIQGAMRRASTANMQQQADLNGLLVEAVEWAGGHQGHRRPGPLPAPVRAIVGGGSVQPDPLAPAHQPDHQPVDDQPAGHHPGDAGCGACT